MKKVRLGIVGLGSMGANHAQSILENKAPRLELTAVADADADSRGRFPQIPSFSTGSDLIHSGLADAILIATPHYHHTPVGIEALKAGLHVLVEKPISVHKADCQKLIAAHKSRKQVFAAMFNQRTDPHYTRIRQLIHSGELGPIRRVQWTITNWFRTQTYYSSGGWRATWGGEGGGVLLNQCPHNLDLFQWMFGMPSRITAFCSFGRYHDIEVEDDVTAYLEYKSGMTATIIASTGEAPGTNRLEIACDRGRLVLEHGEITFTRSESPVDEYCRKSPEKWAGPATWDVSIPISGNGEQHIGILKNFADAILDGTPLIAPAADGIYSVELANAMILSAFEKKTINMPLDALRYEKALKHKIATSKVKKKKAKPAKSSGGMGASFGKV